MRSKLIILTLFFLCSCSSLDENIYIADSSYFSFDDGNTISGMSSESSFYKIRIRDHIDNAKFTSVFESILKNNINVKIKSLSSEIKRLNDASNSSSLPTIGVGVSSSIPKKDSEITYFGSLSTGASVNSILTRLSEREKSDVLARINEVNASIVANSVFVDLSKAIYELQKEERDLVLFQEISDLQKEKVSIKELLFSKSKIEKNVYINSKRRLDEIIKQIENKKNKVSRILYQIKTESGIKLNAEEYIFDVINPSKILSSLSFEHIISKPNVKLKEYEMALSYTDARNANQVFIPEISIGIGTDLLDMVEDIATSTFSNSISIIFPIDIASKLDLKEARIKNYHKSVFEYKKSISEAILNLSKVHSQYKDAKDQVIQSLMKFKERQIELEKAKLKYQLGNMSYIDLIDFKIATLEIKSSYYDDELKYRNSIVELSIEAGYEF